RTLAKQRCDRRAPRRSGRQIGRAIETQREAQGNEEHEMEHTLAPNTVLTSGAVTAFLRKWGPLLLSAIVLPGGIFIALFVSLRRRKQARASLAGPATSDLRGVSGSREEPNVNMPRASE
ncbi:MAG: hypothetical protein ABI024_16520, partial [Vicinamibacterales bacterium]